MSKKNVELHKKKYFEEWNIARGLGVILVVVGHSLPDDNLETISNINLYRFMIDFIYSFHMPLFIFISGFLSIKIINISDMKDRILYMKDKFVRLMVPYFFVGLLYVPLRLIFASFSSVEFNISELIKNFIQGVNPSYQLWTLYVLFLVNVIGVLICRKKTLVPIIGIFLLISLISLQYKTNVNIIDRMMFNSFFFFLGIYIRRFSDMGGQNRVNKVVKLTTIIIFISLNILKFMFKLESLILLTSLLGIIIVYWTSIEIQKKDSIIRNTLNVIGNYGMDIYILSNFAQVSARLIFYSKLDFNYNISFFIIVMVGIFVPMVISNKLIKKAKILRTLILGMK